MKSDVICERVSFPVDGLWLVGNLFRPAVHAPSAYAIVVGGSLTSVKEQMAGTYARKLASRGFITLAFDYRNYGESEGLPRQFEDPEFKLKDLQAAVSFLFTLPAVQSVSALGICTSGGNVAYLAATDRRVRAAACVAAHLADETVLDDFYRSMGKDARLLRQQGEEARRRYEMTGEAAVIPAYSVSDSEASHVGSFLEYYRDPARGGIEEWRNEFAVMSWGPWLAFDPVSRARTIRIPYLMIHSDQCAFPDNAKRFFRDLNGEKELVWDEAPHTDHYDNAAVVDSAVEKLTHFFERQRAADAGLSRTA